jgi:hypothetical protein
MTKLKKTKNRIKNKIIIKTTTIKNNNILTHTSKMKNHLTEIIVILIIMKNKTHHTKTTTIKIIQITTHTKQSLNNFFQMIVILSLEYHEVITKQLLKKHTEN